MYAILWAPLYEIGKRVFFAGLGVMALGIVLGRVWRWL